MTGPDEFDEARQFFHRVDALPASGPESDEDYVLEPIAYPVTLAFDIARMEELPDIQLSDEILEAAGGETATTAVNEIMTYTPKTQV